MGILDRASETERQIIAQNWTSPPVPVGAIANALGLEVKLTLLPPSISGEIRPSATAPSGFRININRHETKERQRFTIAHEIGHYLLHRDKIGEGVADSVMYRSGLSNAIEAEANRVAAELLMPRHLMAPLLEPYGNLPSETAASALAEKMGVSLPAMKIRLGLM